MAYLKYRDLTRYYNFHTELDINSLPDYVTDYVSNGEEVLAAYADSRNKFVLTDRKIILFDVKGLYKPTKRIYIFPFSSITTTSIRFLAKKVSVLLILDSGHPLKLNFVKMLAEDKTKLRQVYMILIDYISLKK